jgi:hypothetical protein
VLEQHTSSESKPTLFTINKKILIVEDEVLFARAVAKRLQKDGFE